MIQSMKSQKRGLHVDASQLTKEKHFCWQDANVQVRQTGKVIGTFSSVLPICHLCFWIRCCQCELSFLAMAVWSYDHTIYMALRLYPNLLLLQCVKLDAAFIWSYLIVSLQADEKCTPFTSKYQYKPCTHQISLSACIINNLYMHTAFWSYAAISWKNHYFSMFFKWSEVHQILLDYNYL